MEKFQAMKDKVASIVGNIVSFFTNIWQGISDFIREKVLKIKSFLGLTSEEEEKNSQISTKERQRKKTKEREQKKLHKQKWITWKRLVNSKVCLEERKENSVNKKKKNNLQE